MSSARASVRDGVRGEPVPPIVLYFGMPSRKPKERHLHWPVLVTAALAIAAVGGLVAWYERGPGAERKAAPPGTTFQAAKEAGATVTPSDPPPKIEVPGLAPAPERR
jgi:hypothetical protein